MDIKSELIKRLDDHGYKLNDEGNIVIKFSELDDDVTVTTDKLTLEIGDGGYIRMIHKNKYGDSSTLIFENWKLDPEYTSKTYTEMTQKFVSEFFPENREKVAELLKLIRDILIEITSETLIPAPQNEIPKRYQTQSGKNFMEILKNEMLTHDEYIGFLKGNIYKYVFRHQKKNGKDDLKKAKHYLDLLEAEIDE